LRLGLLPEGYICAREERAARHLAQAEAAGALPDGADSVDREHHGAANVGRPDEQQPIKRLSSVEADPPRLPPDVTLVLKANLAVCETLRQQIEVLEKRLKERGARSNGTRPFGTPETTKRCAGSRRGKH
jgi:transposase